MLNRVIFSLVVLSFLFLMPSFSQTTDVNLRVDSAFTTINPDTASFGSTFFYAYAVKNMDTVVYASTIYIMAKANNKPAFILDSISPVQLMAGDTIMRYKDDSITPLKYDGGINILVIWPDVPANFHNTNVDSVRKQVDVSGSVSLKDFRNEQLIEIYPNPASSKLQFQAVVKGDGVWSRCAGRVGRAAKPSGHRGTGTGEGKRGSRG